MTHGQIHAATMCVYYFGLSIDLEKGLSRAIFMIIFPSSSIVFMLSNGVVRSSFFVSIYVSLVLCLTLGL